eukprot:6187441-Pleurochrysis_carterae.AAC.1
MRRTASRRIARAREGGSGDSIACAGGTEEPDFSLSRARAPEEWPTFSFPRQSCSTATGRVHAVWTCAEGGGLERGLSQGRRCSRVDRRREPQFLFFPFTPIAPVRN